MRHEPIGKELFITNRKRLVKSLKPGSLVVLNSNDIMPSNADGSLGYIHIGSLHAQTNTTRKINSKIHPILSAFLQRFA